MPTPPSFQLLIKPTGALCNLSCEYCYYLDKEKRYAGGPFRMSDGLLESCHRQLAEAQPLSEISVAWQGGEPLLMGLDFFRRAVAVQQRPEYQGKRFLNTLQTNGTLITEEWAQFFREHRFLVGISIDGPRGRHDAFRRDKAGGPTFDRVRRGLDLLKKHGVEFNALVTIHRANGDHPLEVYRFLRDDLEVRFIQFIPIVRRKGPFHPGTIPGTEENPGGSMSMGDLQKVSPASVTPAQFGRFLIAVYEEWVRRDVGSVFVSPFDAVLAHWAGEPPGLCVLAPTCGQAPILEHNGDLYCCDHFVDSEHLLGNITRTPLKALVGSSKRTRFGKDKSERLPAYCRRCPFGHLCNGGCPKDRFLTAPDGEPGVHYLCAGYRDFFDHTGPTMRIMTELLRLKRAPAEIRNFFSGGTAFPKAALRGISRNEVCPCGSGKKFKHCHGGLS